MSYSLPSGVGSSDFTNSILTDFGITATLYSWTETFDNYSGDPDFSSSAYDSGTSITIVLKINDKIYPLNKEGMLEAQNVKIYISGDQDANKHDKIVFSDGSNSFTWRVETSTSYYDIYKVLNCKLVDYS